MAPRRVRPRTQIQNHWASLSFPKRARLLLTPGTPRVKRRTGPGALATHVAVKFTDQPRHGSQNRNMIMTKQHAQEVLQLW